MTVGEREKALTDFFQLINRPPVIMDPLDLLLYSICHQFRNSPFICINSQL